MTGGSRPFLGWADELDAFRDLLVDPLEHRRPDPALEERLRDMLAEGTVHHASTTPASSRLFADLVEQRREDERVAAMRYAVEGLVARYAADHPDIVR